jgi:transmembrane sensor
MEDYRNFPPERLAADDSFRRWIIENHPSDRYYWENWLLENPDKKELVEKSARLISDSRKALSHPLQEEEIRLEITKLSQAIRKKTVVRQHTSISLWWKLAAAVAVILCLGKLNMQPEQYSIHKNIFSHNAGLSIVEDNRTPHPRLIHLPDRSSVILQPGSTLTYPLAFQADEREVFLDGEAFFEVTKNPDKPFSVYTRTISTKVLGTSFTVTAYSHEPNTTVTVKTGQVSVFPAVHARFSSEKEESTPAATILTPNQQALFNHEDQNFTKSILAFQPQSTDLPILHQSFNFHETPVHEVFHILEKSYGAEIIFPAGKMQNCFLTASLSDEPLLEKLLLICRTIGADYQIDDGKITIISNGCL